MPGIVVSILATKARGELGIGVEQDLLAEAINVPFGAESADIPGAYLTPGACVTLVAYGLVNIGGAPPEGQVNSLAMQLTWNSVVFANSQRANPVFLTGTGVSRWELAALVTARSNGVVCEGRFSILEGDGVVTGIAIVPLVAHGIAAGVNELGLTVTLTGNGNNWVSLEQSLVQFQQVPNAFNCLPDLNIVCYLAYLMGGVHAVKGVRNYE